MSHSIQELAKRSAEIREAGKEQAKFGKAADDYARHRQGFPDIFFERACAWLSQKSVRNGRVLDLGTGTGTVARGFALRGWTVTALDPAPELISQAKLLDDKAGLQGKIQYVIGTAENTTISQDKTFDLITAGTCWHWFDADKAFKEAERLLSDDGHLLVASFDWLPYEGSIALLTEDLILQYNAVWKMGGGTGFHPKVAMDAAAKNWRGIETWTFDYHALYTQEAWRGRVRASAGVLSLPEEKRSAFDAELATILRTKFGNSDLMILHRVFTMVAQKPPSH